MILYQALMALILPVLLCGTLMRGPRGALAERLGLVPPPAPAAPGRGGARLWLHGASNGELASVRWLVAALVKARPGLAVLVSANTASGRAMVAGWGLPGVVAVLAPFDGLGAPGRVLDRWQPQALVIVENELWPARLAAANRRGVAVLVVGGRISVRSAARWGRVAPLARAALGAVDWLSPQDEGSGSRFLALGLAPAALGPVVALKAQAGEGSGGSATPPFAPPAPRAATLLAASTHEGEEGPILAGFAAALGEGAGPRFLILAPRHPRRGDEVEALIRDAGLSFARRSRGEVPGPGTQVYLADTLGEMAHWYAMAGTCLIGGSFVPRGGHTPWEPAAAGCALLHGPSTENFAPAFAALDRAGAAIALRDAADLARVLPGLDAARQAAMAAAAPEALAPFAGGAEAVLSRIVAALPVHLPSA